MKQLAKNKKESGFKSSKKVGATHPSAQITAFRCEKKRVFLFAATPGLTITSSKKCILLADRSGDILRRFLRDEI